MPAKKRKGKAKAAKKSAKPAKDQKRGGPRDAEEAKLLTFRRVGQWLQENYARAVDLFRKLDGDGDNRLTREDFIVGMRMMEVPASQTEMEEMMKTIDEDGDGLVDILEFDKVVHDHQRRLQSAHETARAHAAGILSDEDHELMESRVSFSPSRVSVPCPLCKIGCAEPPLNRRPRYIKLTLTLAPFRDTKAHPGHFEVEVSDGTTAHGLRLHIQDRLGYSTDSIALFREADCSKANFIPPSHCLEHCGLIGSPLHKSAVAEVFYDYMPPQMDCPILMDDSHIREETPESKKTRNKL